MIKYKGNIDKIVIVAFEQATMIINYVKFKKYTDIIDVIVLDQLGDLGYSIKYGIDYANKFYKK